MRKLLILQKIAVFSSLLLLAACAGKPTGLPRLVWPPPPETPRLEFIGTFSSQDDFPKTAGQRYAEAVVGKGVLATFRTPFGIASDGAGIVYISDLHDSNVKVFDFNALTVNYLSKTPVFDKPTGLAVDKSGKLYIADAGKGQVYVYTPQHVPAFVFNEKGPLKKPAYLAINEGLGRIYVSDGMGHQVGVFDLQGKFLFSFGRKDGAASSQDGEFYSPQGLAINGDDKVFVADMYNSRIQVFDADGNFLYKFGERGDQVWQFEYPKDLAFDSDGNLYIIDSRKATILTYTPDGTLLLATGEGRASGNKLAFATPTSVTIDATDRIYVADGLNKRFSVWQYLSDEYLAKHPFTEEDRQRLEEFMQESKGLLEKAP